MKKRLLSLLLAFSMMLTFLPAGALPAFAAVGDTFTSGGLKYEVTSSNTVKVLGFATEPKRSISVMIPEKVKDGFDQYFVTEIGYQAFWIGNRYITSVTIGKNVETIGEMAFYGCFATSFTIPANVKSIGASAFAASHIEGITFEGDQPTLSTSVFLGCSSLKSVTFGKGLTEIPAYAFSYCTSLTSFTIPDSVTSIGDQAFYESGLTSITIPDNVTSIGEKAFEECAELKSVIIPSSIENISFRAFCNCTALTDLTISEGVKSISTAAFMDCTSLNSVTIPNSITSMSSSAFKGCTNLESVTLSTNPEFTSLTDYIFEECSNLTNITIPANVTFIGWKTFSNCKKLKTGAFTIPETVTGFGQNAFSGCDGLTGEITLPHDLRILNSSAFQNCENVTNIFYDGTKSELLNVRTSGWGNWYISDPANFLVRSATGSEETYYDILYKCNVTYNVNGENQSTETVWRHDMLKNVPTPIKEDYVLTWKNGDETFDPATAEVLDDMTLTAVWVPKAVSYKVEHYKEQADGTYALAETDTEIGELDTAVTAKAKVYPGYVEDTENTDRIATGMLKNPASADDILTLKLYYKMVKSSLSLSDAEIISVKDADGNDIKSTITKNDDGSYNIPEGAIVTIEPANKAALANSGSVFDAWYVTGGTLYQPTESEDDTPQTVDTKKEKLTFVMPSESVSISLKTRDATIDEGPDFVGPLVIGATVIAGGAVLGYQTYSLATELAGIYYDLPYFPSNRTALALMLWQDAGKPMPESALLYSDLGQEEQDMELQYAARWAMENELLPDKNDEGTAPEEMKFYPDDAVSKISVLRAWNKAQEMKTSQPR